MSAFLEADRLNFYFRNSYIRSDVSLRVGRRATVKSPPARCVRAGRAVLETMRSAVCRRTWSPVWR
jgi:hypothetical protein